MERHYLYRHIRLDTNEVFYVGIGTKNKRDLKNYTYSRAFSKGSRSNFWKSVINKTKYEVDILLESADYDWVKGKEVEFIKLYGRKDLELGTLCNLTNGGDGTLGYVITEKYRESLKNGF